MIIIIIIENFDFEFTRLICGRKNMQFGRVFHVGGYSCILFGLIWLCHSKLFGKKHREHIFVFYVW